MRIGVITFFQSKDNYGQILQCWALQEFLGKKGYNPFVINFTAKNSWRFQLRWFKKIVLIYPVVQSVLLRLSQYKNRNKYKLVDGKNKYRQFDDFKSKHIVFTESEFHTLSQLVNNPPQAECYITGSDQVWAQSLGNPNNQAYFLNFGSEKVRRISYAPSFAMKVYPVQFIEALKKALSRIDFISVREKDGMEICKSVGYNAIKVLDPTFLLKKEDYLNLISRKFDSKMNYLYIYSLNIQSSKDIRWDELNCYVEEQNLDVVVTPASGYFKGLELFGEEVEYDYATIEKWLHNIDQANLVVTPSFHGIVFCILLETPFVYIPLKGNNAEGNNRIYDLLFELNMDNRILTDDNSYTSIINQSINWAFIKEKIDLLRNESIEFLVSSLK